MKVTFGCTEPCSNCSPREPVLPLIFTSCLPQACSTRSCAPRCRSCWTWTCPSCPACWPPSTPWPCATRSPPHTPSHRHTRKGSPSASQASPFYSTQTRACWGQVIENLPVCCAGDAADEIWGGYNFTCRLDDQTWITRRSHMVQVSLSSTLFFYDTCHRFLNI